MNKLLYRREGRYYLGDSQVSAQYVFQFRDDAPKDLKRSFLVDIEEDGNFSGSALEIANEIKGILDSYWIHSDKDKIEQVIEYLEKWEEKDIYDGLIEERERLKKRLDEIEEKLSLYDHEEMKNWKPKVEEAS